MASHGDKLDVPPVLVATILLVLSSFTMQYGVHRAIRGSKWGFLGWLALTFALGGLFEGLQISDYLGRDFGIDTNAYGSAFYTLTGFHFLHVLAGLVGMILIGGTHPEDPPVRPPHHAGHRVPLLLLALRGRGVDRPVPRHLRAQMTVARPLIAACWPGRSRLIALAIVAGSIFFMTGARAQGQSDLVSTNPADIQAGQQLYQASCQSCHGFQGEGGQTSAPALVSAGAAAADFYLTTGRMPLNNPAQPAHSPPALSSTRCRSASWSPTSTPCRSSPTARPGRPSRPWRRCAPRPSPQARAASPCPRGQQAFAINCAQCHHAAGSGGMLSKGNVVPSLRNANLTQVAEAIRIGPRPMPVFGPGQMNDQRCRRSPTTCSTCTTRPTPGGLGISLFGPVAEGFVGVSLRLWLSVVRGAHDRDQRMTSTDRPEMPPGALPPTTGSGPRTGDGSSEPEDAIAESLRFNPRHFGIDPGDPWPDDVPEGQDDSHWRYENDPRGARRAELRIAFCWTLTMLSSIGLAWVYVAGRSDPGGGHPVGHRLPRPRRRLHPVGP